jgi:hypothetical protein
MNKVIIILIIGIILLLCIGNSKEKFEVVSSVMYNTYEAPYKSDTDTSKPTYQSDLSYTDSPSMKCCLIKKQYVKKPNNIVSTNSSQFYLNYGKFDYKYTKLMNEKCNPSLYVLDSNQQLMIEGDNGWTNDRCCAENINKKLGSCRYANKECFDYVDKEYCDKFSMQWSEKPCNEPLDFKFVDKINIKIPELKGNGEVNLFPQPPDDKFNKLYQATIPMSVQ